MKIVSGQFNDSFVPVMDGVSNVTQNYAHFLNKGGNESYVITPNYPNYIDSQEFDVIRYFSLPIPQRPPYRLGVPNIDLTFKGEVNKIPFNIVHVHCPFSSGQVGLKIAKKRGIPIVATFHSKYYDDFKQIFKSEKIADMIVKRIINFYNSVDFVWTVNKGTMNTLRNYGFKKHIEIVPNGTDFSEPDISEVTYQLVGQRLNLAKDDLVLLFVGQIILQKNLSMLVESLHKLNMMGVKFKMIFVGCGYAENELKMKVHNHNLDSNVQFTGVIHDREFLKALFIRANLFLFPSIYDNAAIVVQEASALRCPSLLIEDSNVSEGIIDKYNGFLSKNDPTLYAKKIKEIVLDKENLSIVGEKAYETLYKSWENVVEEVKLRYTDIIENFGVSRRTP
jgi:1,2-diacylglycerol 3-alpha-glucosyltransferase